MSDVADNLIDIVNLTSEDQKPEVKSICAAIMREQMTIDRLHAGEVERMQAAHAVEVAKLKAEITEYGDLLTQSEIRLALTKLCKRENLDPGIVERLRPHCRYDDAGLTILDRFGVPTSFMEAVYDLEDV